MWYIFIMKLPKSYKDLKCYQLQELETVGDGQELEDILARLTILIGSDADKLTIPQLEIAVDKLKWLNTHPKPKMHKYFRIGGRVFRLKELPTLNINEMSSIEIYANNGTIKNLHNIVAVLYDEITPFKTKNKAELIRKKLSAKIILETSLFFSSVVGIYLQNTAEYMKAEAVKNLKTMAQKISAMQQEKNKLRKSGVGTK
jgi:hypothetical protein